MPAYTSNDVLRTRWMGVGSSADPDAARAGRAATKDAIQGADPKLLVVFCSDSYDLKRLLGGVNQVGGGTPLVGCSTAGEIATDGPGDAGVVVTALGGSGFSISTRKATNVSADLRAAGEKVATSVCDVAASPHKVLMLLSDGLAGNQQELVRGIYAVAGAGVPLVGGCAGDDLKMKSTFQLYNDEVLTDSTVAAALGSESAFGIGVRHGWRSVGEPMMVTQSSNNRVYVLDDQPALDVYLRRLGVPPEAATDASRFTQFAATHPLGLIRRSGEAQVRFVGGANFEDRSLECIAEVPQGGLAWFMEGDEQSVLDATDAACEQAVIRLEGVEPLGMLAFDCIARRGVLGETGIKREVGRIAKHAQGPVAGFYTYGEFARTNGISGFHNQTLVVLAVS